MASGGGGDSQPHLRVTAQSINNSVRQGSGSSPVTGNSVLCSAESTKICTTPWPGQWMTCLTGVPSAGPRSGLAPDPTGGSPGPDLAPRPRPVPAPRPPGSRQCGDQPQHVAGQHHCHCPASTKHPAPVTQPCTGHRGESDLSELLILILTLCL